MGKANVGILGENGLRLPSGTVADPIHVAGGVTEAPNTSTTAATLGRGVITVTAAGTPVPVSDEELLVQSVLFQGQVARTNNTGRIFFGSDEDDVNMIVLAGGGLPLEAPPGQKLDLNTIYIDSEVNGEGAEYLYTL